jgi:hypothetical protein
MVRLYGQDIERIAGDPIVESFERSGFQGIGSGPAFLCFKGGGGGGGDMSPEEFQQQQDTIAKDAEYRGLRRKVADPWLKDLKNDSFNQDERAAIAAGRGSADIEQQVAAGKPNGLRAAISSGADLSTGGGRGAFTDPVAGAADAHSTTGQAARTVGADSRMREMMDGIRLGQDNLQLTGQGMSAIGCCTHSAGSEMRSKSVIEWTGLVRVNKKLFWLASPASPMPLPSAARSALS